MANADRPGRAHDFSEPIWSKAGHLRQWRERLGIGQVELARAAGVAQTTISALERDAEPFTEPSRTRIWNAIARLNAEFLERQAIIHQAVAPDTSIPVSLLYADPNGEGYLYVASGKTPMERLRAEHELLIKRCKEMRTDRNYWKEKAEERQDVARELMDILNLETKKALTEDEKQRKIAALGLQERTSPVEEESLRAEIEQHGRQKANKGKE